MLKTNCKHQTLRMVGLCLVGLVFLGGCNRRSPTAPNTQVLPGLSQPIRVSSGDADAAEPAIAASPDGSVYVAWVNHGPKSQADVMIARFNRDGQMQGSAVRVNPQAGTATAWRGDPPTIAVATDNTIYVGWTARVESEAGHATDLYLSSSRDHGQTFAMPVKVNDDATPAVHGMHSLAIGMDGRVYMAWLDERNIQPMPMKDMKMDPTAKGHHMESNRELFYATSADGGSTFSANLRVASDVCPCCKTGLAVSSGGHLYLSWRQVLPGDLRHIAVSSSPDQGRTFSFPVIVSDDQWVLAGCPVSGPSLSVDGNGRLSVLWYSAGKNGETGLYWCQSNDSGATFGTRRLVTAGLTRGTPILLSTNGTFTSVWESYENGKANVLVASLNAGTSSSKGFSAASDGELPAAAATKLGIVIAYIAKDGQHQDVWVVSASNSRDY